MTTQRWQKGIVGCGLVLAGACSDPSTVTRPREGGVDRSVGEGPSIAAFAAVDIGTAGGRPNSIAHGINVAGTTVGVSYVANPQMDGIVTRWTPAGINNLGRPAGYLAAGALAVNDAGVIVGFANRPGDRHAFMFTPGAGYLVLTGPPGATAIEAWDINNAGTVVGEVTNGAAVHAYRFSLVGGYQDLHPAGYLASHIDGISAAGTMTGWATNPAGDVHAGVWSAAGVFADLGTLAGGTFSRGYDINGVNAVVGQANTAAALNVAMFWRPGVGMNGLPVAQTIGLTLSDLGRMGGYAIVGGARRAATRRGAGPFGLLPFVAGSLETDARAVNLCGTMVGSARFAGGIVHAARWINTPCD